MNQSLKDALREISALPDDDQEEIAQAILVMAARKRIDSRLAASEARGGNTEHHAFMTELRSRYRD